MTILILHPHPPQKSNGSPLSRQHFVFVVLIKMCFQYASHCIWISHGWVISSMATFEVMVEFCRSHRELVTFHPWEFNQLVHLQLKMGRLFVQIGESGSDISTNSGYWITVYWLLKVNPRTLWSIIFHLTSPKVKLPNTPWEANMTSQQDKMTTVTLPFGDCAW